MKIKRKKNKRILFVIALSTTFLLSSLFLSISSQEFLFSNDNDNNYNLFNIGNNVKSQGLTFDDGSVSYSGFGAAWNITHYANATESFSDLSFTNGTTDTLEMPLNSWEGYRLASNIYNLYDIKNWNNGSFHYGADNGTNPGEDDSEYIENQYQNWTFSEIDIGNNNDMSGNYEDNIVGHDCIELRMDGQFIDDEPHDWYRYNEGDKCMWNTSIIIERGILIDCELQFDVNPYHVTNFNSWELTITLNNQKIYSIGIYTLQGYGETEWETFNIPMGLWTNVSSIFSDPLNGSQIDISAALEYNSASASYSSGFSDIEFQQLFLDNIKLIPKAEVKPTQIDLKLNNSQIVDLDWGKGYKELNSSDVGTWSGDKILVEFSSSYVWNFPSFTSSHFGVTDNSSYKIEFATDINLFMRKDQPESTWNKETFNPGTNFEVEDGGLVNWLTYAYILLPADYEETNLTISFPEDVNITEVYTPTDSINNILGDCYNSTAGLLDIPVSTIYSESTGFFLIKGVSPNYYKDLKFYNDYFGGWVENSTVLSGDTLNITAKITKTEVVESYLNQTQAYLWVRFPNGTTWKSQYKNVENDGNVYFNPISIPTSGPEYEFGEYEVAVAWNNSFNNFGLNETGLISRKFTVIHDADFIPQNYDVEVDGVYYFENVTGTIVINIEFKDKVDDTPITTDYAFVYSNYSAKNLTMDEPGVYLLIVDTSTLTSGNTTITVYGNSSYHINKQFDIKFEIAPSVNYLPLFLSFYSNYLRIQEEIKASQRWLIFSIVAGVAAGVGLAGYVILYRVYLKYPPAIRKLRKYRKSLKRKRIPDIATSNRKEMFSEVFKKNVGKEFQPTSFKKLK